MHEVHQQLQLAGGKFGPGPSLPAQAGGGQRRRFPGFLPAPGLQAEGGGKLFAYLPVKQRVGVRGERGIVDIPSESRQVRGAGQRQGQESRGGRLQAGGRQLPESAHKAPPLGGRPVAQGARQGYGVEGIVGGVNFGQHLLIPGIGNASQYVAGPAPGRVNPVEFGGGAPGQPQLGLAEHLYRAQDIFRSRALRRRQRVRRLQRRRDITGSGVSPRRGRAGPGEELEALRRPVGLQEQLGVPVLQPGVPGPLRRQRRYGLGAGLHGPPRIGRHKYFRRQGRGQPGWQEEAGRAPGQVFPGCSSRPVERQESQQVAQRVEIARLYGHQAMHQHVIRGQGGQQPVRAAQQQRRQQPQQEQRRVQLQQVPDAPDHRGSVRAGVGQDHGDSPAVNAASLLQAGQRRFVGVHGKDRALGPGHHVLDRPLMLEEGRASEQEMVQPGPGQQQHVGAQQEKRRVARRPPRRHLAPGVVNDYRQRGEKGQRRAHQQGDPERQPGGQESPPRRRGLPRPLGVEIEQHGQREEDLLRLRRGGKRDQRGPQQVKRTAARPVHGAAQGVGQQVRQEQQQRGQPRQRGQQVVRQSQQQGEQRHAPAHQSVVYAVKQAAASVGRGQVVRKILVQVQRRQRGGRRQDRRRQGQRPKQRPARQQGGPGL